MATTTRSDLLGPDGTPTRATLERYVRGELSASEEHSVERCMEADPLVRDAVDGLQLPGALIAMSTMKPPHWIGGPSVIWSRTLLALALIGAGWAATLLWTKETPSLLPVVVNAPLTDQPFRADSAIAVVKQELASAEALPVAAQIGHEPAQERPVVVRDTSSIAATIIHPVDPAAALSPETPPSAPPEVIGATPTPGSNRRLAFVHDLKLVDPSELYAHAPVINDPGGVPANFADSDQRTERTEPPRVMRYMDFMDEALGRFNANDHSGCLRDLLFLLSQYPKDINARFYAGLCCYNLGLNDRAMSYLGAVVSDPVDTFREEADWYLALAQERAQGPDAVRGAFERIATAKGFYAAKARLKLNVVK
ncbi:MAG: hypothetical protein IPP26_15090 [Flavobacteriales bacterium]|nr:hypothetical protein [Flavobacteriales bacterium]